MPNVKRIPDAFGKELAKLFKKRRAELGWSKQKLCRKSGICRNRITHIEDATQSVQTRTAQRVANTLGIRIVLSYKELSNTLHVPTHPRPAKAPPGTVWDRFTASWVAHPWLSPDEYWHRDADGVDHPVIFGTVRCDVQYEKGRRCTNMHGCKGPHS